MKDNIKLLVAGSQLLGMRVIKPNRTVSTFWYNTSKITQGHNLSTQLASIFDRMFKRTDRDNKVCNIVNVVKNNI